MKSILLSQRLFVFFLMFLCTLSMFSTDIFLPAMPTIAKELHATIGDSQLIISIYFFGLAISQLLSGFLSDHYGRRSMLITALLFYLVGSIGCSVSGNLTFLLVSRFVQGVGAGAIVVLWRAIVIDVYEKKTAFAIIATVAPAIIISPAIAPAIGGMLLDKWGWHSTFAVLIFLGLIALCVAMFFLPETCRQISKTRILIANVRDNFCLFKSTPFILYGSLVCFAYGAYFTYLAQSPFILHQLRLSAGKIGFFYFPIMIAFLIGSQLAKKLTVQMGQHKVICLGAIFFIVGSIGISFVSMTSPNNVVQTMFLFLLLVTGNGVLLTIGVSKALTFFPQAAGTASGLVSFSQSITAFVMTGLVAVLNNKLFFLSLSIPMTLSAMGVIIIFFSIHYLKANKEIFDE